MGDSYKYYRTSWRRRLTVLRAVALRRRPCANPITVEQLIEQLQDQKYLDFYTGEPLSLEIVAGKRWLSASLDRLDNTRGYEKGNVVITTFAINRAKSDMTSQEFFSMCRRVSSFCTDTVCPTA